MAEPDGPLGAAAGPEWSPEYSKGWDDCLEAIHKVLGERFPRRVSLLMPAACEHEWSPIYDHCRCIRCSAVKTDGGWGIASRMIFKSLAEAKFYQGNGRYPE